VADKPIWTDQTIFAVAGGIFTVVAALSVGSLRYRIPAEGPMAIVAASAVAGARRGGFAFRRGA